MLHAKNGAATVVALVVLGLTLHLISTGDSKQLAELRGSDTGAYDSFGLSVAASGTTMVVGADTHDLGGAAYVFSARGSRQTAELKAPNADSNDAFGVSVATSGSTIVVGDDGRAPGGAAYVFTLTARGWKRTAVLSGSDNPGSDFGVAVALSGNTIVVGDDYDGCCSGVTYVFTKGHQGWRQTAVLKGSDTASQDRFGHDVAIFGNTVLVGAPDHASGTGRAYMFTDTTTGWRQTAELAGVDRTGGDDFGVAVAISGNRSVIGSGPDNAYVFTDTVSGWRQTADLRGLDTTASDDFGGAVAISANTIAVGANSQDSQRGRVYLFVKRLNGWYQTGELLGSDTVAGDNFGVSVAVSGNSVVVGAPGHASQAGRAYVFGPS
jgi:hypothetical protein